MDQFFFFGAETQKGVGTDIDRSPVCDRPDVVEKDRAGIRIAPVIGTGSSNCKDSIRQGYRRPEFVRCVGILGNDPVKQGGGSILLDPVEVDGACIRLASVRFLIGPDGKKIFIQRKGKAKFRSGRPILDLVEKGNRSILLQSEKIGGAG